MKIRFLLSSLVILAGTWAHAQDLMIRGARVYTMTEQGVVEKGDVLIRDGKIAQVGPSLSAPRGVEVIDGQGRSVLPGLIDAHSHMTTQDERGGGSDRHERGQRVKQHAHQAIELMSPRNSDGNAHNRQGHPFTSHALQDISRTM